MPIVITNQTWINVTHDKTKGWLVPSAEAEVISEIYKEDPLYELACQRYHNRVISLPFKGLAPPEVFADALRIVSHPRTPATILEAIKNDLPEMWFRSDRFFLGTAIAKNPNINNITFFWACMHYPSAALRNPVLALRLLEDPNYWSWVLGKINLVLIDRLFRGLSKIKDFKKVCPLEASYKTQGKFSRPNGKLTQGDCEQVEIEEYRGQIALFKFYRENQVWHSCWRVGASIHLGIEDLFANIIFSRQETKILRSIQGKYPK